jgi:EmrB/QacA subfamily drug resistance transporter
VRRGESPNAGRWTLVATILASSLTFIDGTVVNVALPALQADLHATIADVQWVIESYALLLGGLLLGGGALGDQLGRKRVFLAGVMLFTAGSIACGLAPGIGTLIVARAFQGLGAAFLVPGSLAIITATFDDAERGRAIGTWSGFSAMTTALGPVLGGWLIEHVSWRAVLFLNVPLAVVVVLLSLRFMDESRDVSRNGRIDWVGATLAVLGLGAVVFALLEWPATRVQPIVLLAVFGAGVAALTVFVLVERRIAEPMLPPALFRSSTFTLANLLTFFLYGALATVFWLVPLNLIQVQHYTATAAGAAMLPFPLLMFLLSRWSGGLVATYGSRLPLTLGTIVAALGLALFARAEVGVVYWSTIFPAITVLGLGMSIVVAPLTTTVMSAVSTDKAGVASGVNNAVSRIAGLVAIALFGVLLVRVFDARVSRSQEWQALPAGARAAFGRELSKLAGADVERAEIVAATTDGQRVIARRVIDESFVAAFRVVMLGSAGAALLAAATGSQLRGDG